MGANRVANKAPYTDEELQRIIEACDKFGSVKWSNGREQGVVYTGEDMKDFISVMVYTGLRISDVGLFHMNRLKATRFFCGQRKTAARFSPTFPTGLATGLMHVQHVWHTTVCRRAIGSSGNRNHMWRRKIGKVFELAGDFEEQPTPHRFRHTFARILLQRGVPVADVADLLGDDEKTVREHYSRWVPERQARLTKNSERRIRRQAETEARSHSGRTPLRRIEQARVYPLRGGLGNAPCRHLRV